MAWCAFRFPPDAPRANVDVLISTCVFYRPNYTKFTAAGSLQDVTHARQASFLTVLGFYERAYEVVPWFRHRVVVRVYYDDSLEAYATPQGTRPWPATMARLRDHPGFQMVWFRADAPRFREGDGHRGLLGTLVRFHAACEGSPPPAARVVAVVDADSFYAKEWWKKQLEFAASPDPGHDVLGLTSPFELMFHAAASVTRPEHVARLKPTLKAGLTSFRRRFPAGHFDAVGTTDFERLRPHMRYLDAMRPAVYPTSQNEQARLFEEFSYGIDELLLNVWLTESDLRVGVVELERSGGPRYFFDRLLAFLRWNVGTGGRSVACQRLAKALGATDGDLVALVDAAANKVTDATSLAAAIAPWKQHMGLWTLLQVDGRILAVIAGAGASVNGAKPAKAQDFIVDCCQKDPAEMLAEMAKWRLP